MKNKKDSRLKCIFAKLDKYGDIICKLHSTYSEPVNCDYGKGICKDYTEEEK